MKEILIVSESNRVFYGVDSRYKSRLSQRDPQSLALSDCIAADTAVTSQPVSLDINEIALFQLHALPLKEGDVVFLGFIDKANLLAVRGIGIEEIPLSDDLLISAFSSAFSKGKITRESVS